MGLTSFTLWHVVYQMSVYFILFQLHFDWLFEDSFFVYSAPTDLVQYWPLRHQGSGGHTNLGRAVGKCNIFPIKMPLPGNFTHEIVWKFNSFWHQNRTEATTNHVYMWHRCASYVKRYWVASACPPISVNYFNIDFSCMLHCFVFCHPVDVILN